MCAMLSSRKACGPAVAAARVRRAPAVVVRAFQTSSVSTKPALQHAREWTRQGL